MLCGSLGLIKFDVEFMVMYFFEKHSPFSDFEIFFAPFGVGVDWHSCL